MNQHFITKTATKTIRHYFTIVQPFIVSDLLPLAYSGSGSLGWPHVYSIKWPPVVMGQFMVMSRDRSTRPT